uniref:Uncharacterized protein n=1 Tax=Meloidogyne javanica TaxID=6303 RepID=A0A915N7P2_MELJA
MTNEIVFKAGLSHSTGLENCLDDHNENTLPFAYSLLDEEISQFHDGPIVNMSSGCCEGLCVERTGLEISWWLDIKKKKFVAADANPIGVGLMHETFQEITKVEKQREYPKVVISYQTPRFKINFMDEKEKEPKTYGKPCIGIEWKESIIEKILLPITWEIDSTSPDPTKNRLLSKNNYKLLTHDITKPPDKLQPTGTSNDPSNNNQISTTLENNENNSTTSTPEDKLVNMTTTKQVTGTAELETSTAPASKGSTTAASTITTTTKSTSSIFGIFVVIAVILIIVIGVSVYFFVIRKKPDKKGKDAEGGDETKGDAEEEGDKKEEDVGVALIHYTGQELSIVEEKREYPTVMITYQFPRYRISFPNKGNSKRNYKLINVLSTPETTKPPTNDKSQPPSTSNEPSSTSNNPPSTNNDPPSTSNNPTNNNQISSTLANNENNSTTSTPEDNLVTTTGQVTRTDEVKTSTASKGSSVTTAASTITTTTKSTSSNVGIIIVIAVISIIVIGVSVYFFVIRKKPDKKGKDAEGGDEAKGDAEEEDDKKEEKEDEGDKSKDKEEDDKSKEDDEEDDKKEVKGSESKTEGETKKEEQTGATSGDTEAKEEGQTNEVESLSPEEKRIEDEIYK